MTDFLMLLVVALLVWVWWDSQQCRLIATQAAITACNNFNLQFLDGTVHLRKYWPIRSKKFGISMCRLYFFEYSDDGNQRAAGRLVLVGKQIFEVKTNAYADLDPG